MRKTALFALAALGLLAISGLAAEQPRVGPPPVRVESPTLRPSEAHVWLPGFWKWKDVNYEWVEGRWGKAKKGREWVPGAWEQVGSRWVWKPGKWRKIETGEPKPAKSKKKK